MDILLVAGLWLDGSVWDRTAATLTELGHRPVPLTLPGQGAEPADATLADQLAAVLAAVDASVGKPLVVGHSAAASLAWLAADARPSAVAGTVLIGGFPVVGGQRYADLFPVVDGAMPFPGWEPFAGPDSDDLGAAARQALAAGALPVPAAVAHGIVRLRDEARFDVPTVLVCPEFTPDQARAWVAGGDVPELARARRLTYVDLDSGHWPMVSSPAALAAALAAVADGLAA